MNKLHSIKQESNEIYSKIYGQQRIKLIKSKRLSAQLSEKVYPITIIQAPITVNGDSSVNVHQSIVLAKYARFTKSFKSFKILSFWSFENFQKLHDDQLFKIT